MGTDTIGQAFLNGVEDRHVNGLLRVEQLYRSGRAQRWAWTLGWVVADLLTSRKLRNEA
jgi:hypothetical protein